MPTPAVKIADGTIHIDVNALRSASINDLMEVLDALGDAAIAVSNRAERIGDEFKTTCPAKGNARTLQLCAWDVNRDINNDLERIRDDRRRTRGGK
jgi:hypothetical protein